MRSEMVKRGVSWPAFGPHARAVSPSIPELMRDRRMADRAWSGRRVKDRKSGSRRRAPAGSIRSTRRERECAVCGTITTPRLSAPRRKAGFRES